MPAINIYDCIQRGLAWLEAGRKASSSSYYELAYGRGGTVQISGDWGLRQSGQKVTCSPAGARISGDVLAMSRKRQGEGLSME